MSYIILVALGIFSYLLVYKTTNLSKTLVYIASVTLSIFTWNAYILLIDGFLDPFIFVSSLISVPILLFIVIVVDGLFGLKGLSIKDSLISGLAALFIIITPLIVFISYTSTEEFKSFTDEPNWNDKEKKIVYMAVDELREHPLRTSDFGLANKSLVFQEESMTYRVIFSFKGHELAEVIIDKDVQNIISVKVRQKKGYLTTSD